MRIACRRSGCHVSVGGLELSGRGHLRGGEFAEYLRHAPVVRGHDRAGVERSAYGGDGLLVLTLPGRAKRQVDMSQRVAPGPGLARGARPKPLDDGSGGVDAFRRAQPRECGCGVAGDFAGVVLVVVLELPPVCRSPWCAPGYLSEARWARW